MHSGGEVSVPETTFRGGNNLERGTKLDDFDGALLLKKNISGLGVQLSSRVCYVSGGAATWRW